MAAIEGKKKIPLTLKSILERVTEYEIYRYYLGQDFRFKEPIHSPFRRDSNPSFAVMVTRRGFLHHMDFGDSSIKGNCVDFVKQLYSVDYYEALRRIDSDMGLGIRGKLKDYKTVVREFAAPETKAEKFIQVVTRRFNTDELKYWAEFYITEEELKANHVYAIKQLFIDRQRKALGEGLSFGYLFEDKWKIYRPLASKEEKFAINNVPNDRMSGMHRITEGCNIAVVTKSKKDEILLAKFLPHVCSVQSENTVVINKENISLLQKRCGKTFINFDSDKTGIEACTYYNQFGFGWVNCPHGYTKPDGTKIKDFSDLAKYYGMEIVINHFKMKGIYA